jgi:NAD(P)-dependent dehydrogenase (short-subunit alcohol dehydrogenase family)
MVVLVAGAGILAATIVSLVWRRVKRQAEVEGKTVFVTGGSEGIGKAVATDFVRRGANVVVMARTEAKLKSAVEELESVRQNSAQRIGFQVMDVTDFPSVQRVWNAIVFDNQCRSVLPWIFSRPGP